MSYFSQKQFRFLPKAALGLACLIFIGILLLMKQGYLETLELTVYDTLIQWRPEVIQPTAPVILVKVTEKDILRLQQWPVSDAVLAETLQRLVDYGPRVIGLDIYRDLPVPPGHSELNAVLSENNMIIGTMKMPENTQPGVPAPPVLHSTKRVGFNDIIIDPDGIVRRGLLYMEDTEEINQSSFSLQIALRYLLAEGVTPKPDPIHPEHMRLGSITLLPFETNDGGYVNADAKGYQFLMDFRDVLDDFISYSLTDVLSGNVKPALIKDKIVVVGITSVSVKDNFWTPVKRNRNSLQMTRGLELHALMVNQLLRHALQGQATIKTLSDWQEIIWILAWCVLGSVVGLHADYLLRFTVFFTLGFAALFSSVWFAFSHNLWIPLVAPTFAWIFTVTLVAAYSAFQQKQQRTQLMNLFSRHVAPEIAEQIWQHRDQFIYAGWPKPQRLTATVMFTDICHFTAISEHLSPPELVAWLNEYMEALIPIIERHGGVINKFIGDAIMAMFGAPLPSNTDVERQTDARNAVKCAIAIQNVLKQRNQDWQQRGLPAVGMRIGIHTGDLVAGCIGAYQRMEYTLYGDTVNIAARLENFDKDSFIPHPFDDPCRILIGESTFKCLDQYFEVEALQTAFLRGKTQEVTIYRVKGQEL